MRTQVWKGMLAAVAAVGLMAGSAMAASLTFGFNGNNSGGGWSVDAKGDGTGTIDLYKLEIDGANAGNVGIMGYTLGDMSFNYTVTGGGLTGSVTFDPGFYANGFNIYDNGTLVLTADLTMPGMDYYYAAAAMNATLTVNLTNVQVTNGYSSPILDQFALSQAGILIITLNSLPEYFADVLNTAGTYSNTLSGSGAPSSSVPEPATMLLFGAGLLGLSGVARRRMS